MCKNILLIFVCSDFNVLLMFAKTRAIKAVKKVSQLIFGTSGHEIADFRNKQCSSPPHPDQACAKSLFWFIIFLAVQNSSIGDLVTDSLSHSLLLLPYK